MIERLSYLMLIGPVSLCMEISISLYACAFQAMFDIYYLRQLVLCLQNN